MRLTEIDRYIDRERERQRQRERIRRRKRRRQLQTVKDVDSDVRKKESL